MNGPDPRVLRPRDFAPSLVFLAPLAEGRARVEVGRFSYYNDPTAPEAFFDRNLLYHFEFGHSWLRIGPFCALAAGTQILMDGANHAMGGFSTYPFDIFHDDWRQGTSSFDANPAEARDTVIGPDVWVGHGATLLPGAQIGAGAIIGAMSVVGGEVAPYTVVAGNPARPVRVRFAPAEVERLLTLAWWDWPVDKITRNLGAIRGGDLDALEALA